MAFALLLATLAGLSTAIGGAIAFFTKRTNTSFLSVALGFSAGVMIYISFVEILSKSKESLSLVFGPKIGNWINILSFFLGILVIAIIDALIPSNKNPHEVKEIERISDKNDFIKEDLFRKSFLIALAITIHNFPEGIATFISALIEPKLGISIAIAVAIHNIPEGISVSVPLFYSTGNRKLAFLGSALSGFAEPLGALIGMAFFSALIPKEFFGIIFASVAGIMVYISFDELLPAAREYGKHHYAIGGLIVGMLVMAVSLALI